MALPGSSGTTGFGAARHWILTTTRLPGESALQGPCRRPTALLRRCSARHPISAAIAAAPFSCTASTALCLALFPRCV